MTENLSDENLKMRKRRNQQILSKQKTRKEKN